MSESVDTRNEPSNAVHANGNTVREVLSQLPVVTSVIAMTILCGVAIGTIASIGDIVIKSVVS